MFCRVTAVHDFKPILARCDSGPVPKPPATPQPPYFQIGTGTEFLMWQFVTDLRRLQRLIPACTLALIMDWPHRPHQSPCHFEPGPLSKAVISTATAVRTFSRSAPPMLERCCAPVRSSFTARRAALAFRRNELGHELLIILHWSPATWMEMDEPISFAPAKSPPFF